MGEFGPEPVTFVRRLRVLVADDDDDIRALLVAALQADGYIVMEARDGRDAIDRIAPSMLFDENLPAPDAIITDIRMPGISGSTLLAGLRANGWATPIIVITAYDIDQVRPELEELGADAVFGKPFDVDDVRTALAHVLRWRRRDGR